jgi:hypothetical protein
LAVEHATTEGAALLERHGISSIALRGPALVRLLYSESEARTSLDVDLLVPDLRAASAALVEAGYERVVDWTPGMERHAWTHVREGAVTIDLHRTLVGIETGGEAVWTVFFRESASVELVGGTVRVPGSSAQAMTVALHAAQHGRETPQTLGDLERALSRFDLPTWKGAAVLAGELSAVSAFGSGLRLLDDGAALADELRLPVATTTRDAVRAAHGSAEPALLGLATFRSLHGRQRVAFGIGKAFPPAAFMRERYPVARRGFVGLGGAYVYRAAWLAWMLPKGVRRLRSIDRTRTR